MRNEEHKEMPNALVSNDMFRLRLWSYHAYPPSARRHSQLGVPASDDILPPFSQGQQCERSLDSHPLRTRLDRAATG